MQHNADNLQRIVDMLQPHWYSGLYMEEEEKMFDPMTVLDQLFTVTFLKGNGDVRSMTGCLVEPYKYDSVYVSDYCATLITKEIIPMITVDGWRSFTVKNVIKVEMIGK